jgi:hypothetical protein
MVVLRELGANVHRQGKLPAHLHRYKAIPEGVLAMYESPKTSLHHFGVLKQLVQRLMCLNLLGLPIFDSLGFPMMIGQGSP